MPNNAIDHWSNMRCLINLGNHGRLNLTHSITLSSLVVQFDDLFLRA